LDRNAKQFKSGRLMCYSAAINTEGVLFFF
jgi:hypothetical protein